MALAYVFRTGTGVDGDPFRPDMTLVEAPGAWYASFELPNGDFVVQFEGEPATLNGVADPSLTLADKLPQQFKSRLANIYGGNASKYNNMTIGEALFLEEAPNIVPETDRSTGQRRYRIWLGKGGPAYDAPVVEGGAVDTEPFTYSNGILETVSSGVWASSNTGSSRWEVISNQAVINYNSGATGWRDLAIYQTSLSTDMTAEATLTDIYTDGNADVGLVVRSDSTGANCIFSSWTNNHYLDKRTAGSNTNITFNYLHGLTEPLGVVLDANGTTITSRDAGSNDTISATVTDHASNTYAGIVGYSRYNVNVSLDDWQVTYTAGGGFDGSYIYWHNGTSFVKRRLRDGGGTNQKASLRYHDGTSFKRFEV